MAAIDTNYSYNYWKYFKEYYLNLTIKLYSTFFKTSLCTFIRSSVQTVNSRLFEMKAESPRWEGYQEGSEVYCKCNHDDRTSLTEKLQVCSPTPIW